MNQIDIITDEKNIYIEVFVLNNKRVKYGTKKIKSIDYS